MNFLCDKKFELDDDGKNFLLNYSNIFSISSTLISYLMIYESSFDCQYISYLIIKRLYFIFPQFRDKIEDLLPIILTNIISFKNEQIKGGDNSYKFFFKFLLEKGEQKLKDKLNVRIKLQNLEKNLIDEINELIIDNYNINYENIFLNEFNLKIGCPLNLEINAGYSEEKTEGSKIILFVKNPGIYKLVFDNTYSWINAKTVKYRISILKEIIDN